MVREFVTDKNSLLITVDNERFYELRDLTPRDLIWIDHQKESDVWDVEIETSVAFLTELFKRLTVNSNALIEDEDWDVYIEIVTIVQKLVLANRMAWKDFVAFVFAAGHKSFSCYEFMLDTSMTHIMDMYTALMEFYEQQEHAMDEASGRIKR